VSQSESGGGGWLGGGVFWRLGERFNLGLAARFTSAEVRFPAGDIEAGGTHLGLTLGWGWPAGR
jgi:hypothetical protein